MKSWWAGIAAAFLTASFAAPAQNSPHYPIEQYRLSNGLKIVLSEDHTVPVVGLALAYDVGSRDEVKGRTGFAHLFEHLMFQGSAHVPKGAFDEEISASGGISNGFTRPEVTTYIETVPAEKLPLILWLEADRMRSLAVTPENLKNQQEVVKEEKRLRYDNQPYVNAREGTLQGLAFSNFANRHTVIGSMTDIDNATLNDVRAFFRTNYAPNNAVLVLVGDFNARQALHMIADEFGDIPRQPAPRRPDLSEPPQRAERRTAVTDRLATLPAIAIAWHAPSIGTPDSYAVDLLNEILFEGESSRAYQLLVKGKQMALDIQGDLDDQRGPSLFELFAVYRPNISEQDMERALYALVDGIKRVPPAKDELERVKTRFLAARYRSFSIYGLESMLGRAIQIADYTVFEHDPNLVNTDIDRYMAVTPGQIREAARRYFSAANRTVVVVKPGAAGGSKGAAR